MKCSLSRFLLTAAYLICSLISMAYFQIPPSICLLYKLGLCLFWICRLHISGCPVLELSLYYIFSLGEFGCSQLGQYCFGPIIIQDLGLVEKMGKK